jgi:C4-dicarboxylate-specific signal transduction histidine kinase
MWKDSAQIKRWRTQAEEIRTYADNTRDLGSRDSLQRVAKDYDQLADRAERHARSPAHLRLIKR